MSASKSDDQWQFKDIWLGLLFLASGILLIVYAYLVTRNGFALLAGSALIVGPIFLLLGANSCIRSLVAAFKKPNSRNE